MAGFCQGFAFETDVSAALTIEGNEVDGFNATSDQISGRLPSGEVITASSVEEFVKRYVDRTGALERRQKAREEHLRELNSGREAWNAWRRENPQIQPMLACVDASSHFKRRDLDRYDFSYTNFCEAKLRGLDLRAANFHQAILAGADLSDARLEGANFCRTDLYKTKFRNAWLTGANLQGVQLARTDLTGAHLNDCKVYGMSTWDLQLTGAEQQNLIIRYQAVAVGTDREETVAVDGLDVAAFMYFTLNNRNIARIIEAASLKWVLILGRFSEGRSVLDRVADELKQHPHQFVPIIFDFERTDQRDLIETVILLAGLSAFIIVEISNPRSTPLELQVIASNYGIPIFPIMKRGAEPFAMFSGLRKFRWVFRPLIYETTDELIARLPAEVIAPAMEEARRLADWKRSSDGGAPSNVGM